MARTEAEKYTTRRYQDHDGRWHTTWEFVPDSRYCDICDSEDVEQPRELVTGNGWYGGVKILWSNMGGVHGPKVVQVLCRPHAEQHKRAEWEAERRLVEVDGWSEAAYYCPAHGEDHYEIAGEHEARRAELREFTG